MSRLRVLDKTFDGRSVLRHFSLVVGKGELATLLGPSGCGKTKTLRGLACLERPDSGEIRIGECMVVSPATGTFDPPNRRGIGMVFQDEPCRWSHSAKIDE